jgi:hypothetical protein
MPAPALVRLQIWLLIGLRRPIPREILLHGQPAPGGRATCWLRVRQPLSEPSCCHQRSVIRPRSRVPVPAAATGLKRRCSTEPYRITCRRSWRIWKREAANCPPSCLTSSRPIFAVAFQFTAFFASGAKTVGTAELWLSRANDVDFARAVLVAAWPTRQLSAWITSSPRAGAPVCPLATVCLALQDGLFRRCHKRGAWRIHQCRQLRPPPPRTEAQAARSAANRKPDRGTALWIVAESECSFSR